MYGRAVINLCHSTSLCKLPPNTQICTAYMYILSLPNVRYTMRILSPNYQIFVYFLSPNSQSDSRVSAAAGEEEEVVEMEEERELSPQEMDQSEGEEEYASEEGEEEKEEDEEEEGPPPRPGRRVKFEQRNRLAVEFQDHGLSRRSKS